MPPRSFVIYNQDRSLLDRILRLQSMLGALGIKTSRADIVALGIHELEAFLEDRIGELCQMTAEHHAIERETSGREDE